MFVQAKRAACALVAALVIAACGGGGDDDGDTLPTTTRSPATTEGTTTTSSSSTTSSTTTTVPSTQPGPTTTTAAPPPATSCAETRNWNTQPESDDTMLEVDFYNVRVGQHRCYDRVVFDINGVVPGADVVGYNVNYVANGGEVAMDGSGNPVPTTGATAIQVVVRAPALGFNPNSGRLPTNTLEDEINRRYPAGTFSRWKALQDIKFAGSTGGQTTIAVGVRQQRPFRVGAFELGGYSYVYVDIAH